MAKNKYTGKYYRTGPGQVIGWSEGSIVRETDFAEGDLDRLQRLNVITEYDGPVDDDGNPVMAHAGDLSDGDGVAITPDGTDLSPQAPSANQPETPDATPPA